MSDGTLRVIILTCSDLGWESAAALRGQDGVAVVAVARAPAYRPRPLGQRIVRMFRREGALGPVRAVARRLLARPAPPTAAVAAAQREVPLLDAQRFEEPATLERLRAERPDVFVVDGAYVLPTSVITLPRLGTINLHCGKLPTYRGSPPVFWELYNGATEVGVTVHVVTEGLDQGPILRQRVLPLDPAPPGDPVAHATRVWREQLRPAGLELIAEVLQSMRRGDLVPAPQAAGAGTTYRPPDHAAVAELRRRVAARRAGR